MEDNYEQNYGDEQYQEDSPRADHFRDESSSVNGSGRSSFAPKAFTDEERKLFIGGLSWDTREMQVKEYFSKYGDVKNVSIKTDPMTGKPRGFGFITFATEVSLEDALKDSPHNINGKQIEPRRAKARPTIKKIFVGGLDPYFPEADINAYFGKYGNVEKVELPFDKVTKQRRHFCFVTFETDEACRASCKQARQTIGNKECDVKKVINKPDPRSVAGETWREPAPVGRGGPRGRGTFGFHHTDRYGNPGYRNHMYESHGYPDHKYESHGYPDHMYENRGYHNDGYESRYYSDGYESRYPSDGYDSTGYSDQRYDNAGYRNQGSGGYSQNSYGNTAYGQQQSNYGRAPRRRGAARDDHHPYSHYE